MPRKPLTADQRREMVLSALSGASRVELAQRYGVARSWVYALLDEARTDPGAKLEGARKELEFRQKVAALQPHQAKPSEAEEER